MQQKDLELNMVKKQSWIRENYIYVIIISGLMLAFIFTENIRNSTSYICSKSPEKCVCEEKLNKIIPCGYFTKPVISPEEEYKLQKEHCTFKQVCRLKTQAELDIDDCNGNPRDDDLCRCEEKDWRLAGLFNQVRLKERNISIDDFKYITYSYLDNFKIECRQPPIQDCFVYERTDKCLKSRPKTNWEKHPEDYVVEIKEIINEEWINNCCEDVNINLQNSNFKYSANKICFEANDKNWRNVNSINTTKCKHTPKTINQTTYRPKTECEKKYFKEGKYVLIGDSIDGFYQICQKGSYEGEDCYEGNPDWVEETNFAYEINCNSSIAPCYRFISKQKDKISALKDKISALKYSSIFTDFKDESFYTELAKNVDVISYETICREKNDVEKLKDRGCEDLSHIQSPTMECNFWGDNWQNQNCKNIQQAWMEKGCQI